MAHNDARKAWRAFKSRHPGFEKSKNFKSDVGPQFDKMYLAMDQYDALRASAQKKLQLKAQEVVKLGNSAIAAMRGYEAVVKQVQATTDKTILADSNQTNNLDVLTAYIKQWETTVTITPHQ